MCLWFTDIIGVMSKLCALLKTLAYISLLCMFLYFVSPFFQQRYINFVSSPAKNDDAITVIVVNPTRLRDLVIRVNISDDCKLGGVPIVGCLGNYVTLSGALEVYASVYGEVHGQVASSEAMEVGVYVYSESDGINNFLLSGCSNLEHVSGGRRDDILKGTSRQGRTGELYSLGDGYFSAVTMNGEYPAGYVRKGCPYEGGLFSISGEHVEVLAPHVSYEFKGEISSDVRERLFAATRVDGVPPLNSVRQDCSLLNGHIRHEYLSRSMESELSELVISSQVCSHMSERYRVDRAYADSVKDEAYLFDRGLPYVNEAQVSLRSPDSVDSGDGDLNSVYVRFRDEYYSDNETMALFWAALIGSPLISYTLQGGSWFVRSFPIWLSFMRECGNEFYEGMKEKGSKYGRS